MQAPHSTPPRDDWSKSDPPVTLHPGPSARPATSPPTSPVQSCVSTGRACILGAVARAVRPGSRQGQARDATGRVPVAVGLALASAQHLPQTGPSPGQWAFISKVQEGRGLSPVSHSHAGLHTWVRARVGGKAAVTPAEAEAQLAPLDIDSHLAQCLADSTDDVVW
ncbi:hypothetical protein CB1_000298012 [Camelus ferus]|nr:hypothetical protein CB1_000298012 [Camelus ferus]